MVGKRVCKIAVIVLVIFLLYLIIGACAPFIPVKTLQDTGPADKIVAQVQTDRESPDRAKIIEANQEALEERIRLIHMAEENIVLTTFDMREGESTSDILAMLYERAENGVKVQILVDGISGFVRMKGVPLFLTVASHENIEIRIYDELNPLLPWKAMGCMHDKYLIIDHKAYLLGGRNTFDYFIGEYPTDGMSYDREALIYNTNASDTKSSVYELYDYFEEMWSYEESANYGDESLSENDRQKMILFLRERYESLQSQYPDLFEPYDYAKDTFPTKGVTLLANEKHIYGKEPVVFYELTKLIGQAKKNVIIHAPYAVMNHYMVETMKSACASVPVTMMVNARENGDNLMASSDYTYHVDDVLDTGVQLLEYMGGISYHGKSLVIDDEIAIVGSYNFDMRSTYVDTELMLAIRSPETAAELKGYMQEYHKACRRVEPDGSVEVPDGVSVPELSVGKKLVFHGLGAVLQLFRVFV